MVSAAEQKKHKWQYLSPAVSYQVTLLLQGRRRKLTPPPNSELQLAQSPLATGGIWERASGTLLLVACSQRLPPPMLSGCSRIPRTPMTLASAGLPGAWAGPRWCSGNRQTTLPHACQPWATELLSGDAGTDGLLAVNKPVCREFQGAGLGLLTCSGYLN